MFTMEWFSEQIVLRFMLSAAIYLLAGRWYFKRTNGGGKIIFALGCLVLGVFSFAYPGGQLILWILVPVIWQLERRNRRETAVYSPATATVEGGGIKRGLTAPEASILLGSPFSKSALMILIGLLQKKVLHVENTDPFSVSIDARFRSIDHSLDGNERKRFRDAAASDVHIILQTYEEHMLELLERSGKKPVTEIEFGILIMPLVEMTSERMAGYDVGESRAYYREIVKRAPIEARMDGSLETEREKVFDRNLSWLLLGDEFEQAFAVEGKDYLPSWLKKKPGKVNSLGEWLQVVLSEMRSRESGSRSGIKVRGDLDELSAKLAADITRATFYS